MSERFYGRLYVIVPRGRIEDPPAPKIKIFSSTPAAGGCLPPLQHISALQHTFSRIFANCPNFTAKRTMAKTYAQVEARIEQIIASINTESKLSVRRLAHQHHVPIGRLRSRLAGAPSKSSMGGHNKKLSEAQELVLCSYLSRLSRIGVNARRHMLQTAANTLLRQTHKHSKRKPPIVGQHWADISEDPAIVRGKYNASPYRYARPDTWGGVMQGLEAVNTCSNGQIPRQDE